jgi:hypothetical protein
MENVLTRINQVKFILPNPALTTASHAVISQAKEVLKPVIEDERVVQFINAIHQQDLRTELLRSFWDAKTKGLEHLEDHPITDDTYLTSLSFLLSAPGVTHIVMMKMFDEVERVFNSVQEGRLRAEAADIMLRFYPERSKKMFEVLRESDQLRIKTENVNTLSVREEYAKIERTISKRNERKLAEKKLEELRKSEQLKIQIETNLQNTIARARKISDDLNDRMIYEDPQNVHNTTINMSVITAARALIKKMVATVTFDGRYTFNVFRNDTVETITKRLSDVLKKSPITISGEQGLQPEMTFSFSEETKSTIESSRFRSDEITQYLRVIGNCDYVFPDHLFPEKVNRDSDLGRRLCEIFIATNKFLDHVFKNEVEKQFLFHLASCGIPDAEKIWSNRYDIWKDLNTVMRENEQKDKDIDEFLCEVVNDVFPASHKYLHHFNKRIKLGSVRDVKILQLLNAVWKFIHTKKGDTFIEMKKRLREEILEGMEVCTSGLCAHLVSVIQGYFDEDEEPSLKIRMSVVEELQGKLIHNINTLAIKRNVDPVLEYVDFKKLVDEYIDRNVEDILDEFTADSIKMNGLSKQMIITTVYRIYGIKT